MRTTTPRTAKIRCATARTLLKKAERDVDRAARLIVDAAAVLLKTVQKK